MEHKTDLEALELLLPAVIFGAEDEGSDDSGSDDGGDADGENEDSDAGSDAGEDDGADDSPGDRRSDDGLKSALRKERARANAAEKKLKAKEKAEADAELAKRSDIEQAQIREQKALERAEKLANGFLQTNLNAAIREAAKSAGFIDPSDAIEGVDRTGITYEQDEDDPSQVDIDQKTIVAAVKKLAAKKPHFIRSGTDDGEPTGSQFGGTRQKKKTTEEELKSKYSALRHS